MKLIFIYGNGGTAPRITGGIGPTTILPSVRGLTSGIGTPCIDIGGGPGPRQPPRTPDEDPSYRREKIPRGEPGGASRPWAAICSALGIGGLLLGGIIKAETSDSRIVYPLEGGGAGLVLCAFGIREMGLGRDD